MKKILGLDLGTNSIGWAVVNADDELDKVTGIVAAGSRIIPMTADELKAFNSADTSKQSKCAARTQFRSIRRNIERTKLRRSRLLRVLNALGFLPEHFASQIDRYGNLIDGKEPKLAWREDAQGKMQFLFKESFEQMVHEFHNVHPELVANNKLIPYDWTLYYLRKKALKQRITKEELAWILLSFNQKRGYYQLRGEDDDKEGERKEYMELKVLDVKPEDTMKRKGKQWFIAQLDNGLIYKSTNPGLPLWQGKTKAFIVTYKLNDDGTIKKDKEGNDCYSMTMPQSDDDYNLLKEKTKKDIDNSGKTVGEYIYDAILANPDVKIRGGLVRTIERRFYKEELRQILATQCSLHDELHNRELYEKCINELYTSNEAYRQSISGRDFVYLFLDDIIFYQRPLKSKTSLIADCPFEVRHDKDGKKIKVKCAPKSHPLFQEFRIWQFMANLRILCRECEIDGRTKIDIDVTQQHLGTEEQRSKLFYYLYDRKSVKQKDLLGFFFGKNEIGRYRWNYVDDPDKEYPCNPTRADMLAVLKKLEKLTGTHIGLLPAWREPCDAAEGEIKETDLWHILHSVTAMSELKAALHKFARRNNLPAEFADEAAKIKPYEREYAAYSLKAIKKLLPLMRCGAMWSFDNIDSATRQRIENLVNGEFDETISSRVREKSIHITSPCDFKGLPQWLACYVVYNRHSEANADAKWKTPDDMRSFITNFKHGSLRNPVVEQVVLETLRTVADIWQHCGTIDEIHVELGREMKNPADKRKRIYQTVVANENTNARIREMMNYLSKAEYGIKNLRPESPYQQELLKLYLENAYLADECEQDDLDSILSKTEYNDVPQEPTNDEIKRIRYISPYTGQIIPLSRLFTRDYEIEHVIPQSRFFDDSFSNKVICEAAVNKLKDKLLGYEFIKSHHGAIVDCGCNRTVKILEVDAYERLVANMYAANKAKREKLMMEDIPDTFIARQLNDSRYMSRYILSLLSRIVRDDDEQESTSKHVIPVNGAITDRLKQDWGVNNKWNELILPRFERMNKITGTGDFTYVNKEGKVVPTVPINQMKGFNKKRIDHRHHAMDAIVIACTTRSHVNLLNNESARTGNREMRYALSSKLRRKEDVVIDGVKKTVFKFYMPWDSFPADVLSTLQGIIVSFKNKVRIIQKSANKYTRFVEKDGVKNKVVDRQDSSRNVTVRKSLHKESNFGLALIRKNNRKKIDNAINDPSRIVDRELRTIVFSLIEQFGSSEQVVRHLKANAALYQKYDLNNVEVFESMGAKRDRLISKFDFKSKKEINKENIEKRIRQITDTGIQKILLAHLEENLNNLEFAFSPEGLAQMNENITLINGGVPHKPIEKARFMEALGMKFPKGQVGCKSKQFVEADEGANLYFAVYKGEDGKRSFETIQLKDAITALNSKLPVVAPQDEKGRDLLFCLSPGDLVYVPTAEELESGIIDAVINPDNVYSAKSFDKGNAYFVKANIANQIINQKDIKELKIQDPYVFSDNNDANIFVRTICVPVKVDRLGKIIMLNRKL